MKEFLKNISHNIMETSCFIAAIPFVLIPGFQIFNWLRTGEWDSFTVAWLLWKMEFDLKSIYSPNEWFGLAKLGQWFVELPVSIVAPIVIVLFGIAVSWIISDISEYIFE